MAKFKVNYSAGMLGDSSFYSPGTTMDATSPKGSVLNTEDLLNCIMPAANRLAECYKQTIRKLFKRRSGQLIDSIIVDDRYVFESSEGSDVFVVIKPDGRRKNSKTSRKSKAGPSNRKYAKHRRTFDTRLKNEDLAYFLEYGTPRIAATHWMENTNEEVATEIQDMIETNFTELLKKKGLIE